MSKTNTHEIFKKLVEEIKRKDNVLRVGYTDCLDYSDVYLRKEHKKDLDEDSNERDF